MTVASLVMNSSELESIWVNLDGSKCSPLQVFNGIVPNLPAQQIAPLGYEVISVSIFTEEH